MKNKKALSVDLGGTHVAYAVVSVDGSLAHRGRLMTRDYSSFGEMLLALRTAVSALDFDAVAFCAPAVDSQGVVAGAVDLPWPSPYPLAAEAARIFGKPCAACNDANAAAMGEGAFGAGKGLDNFIVLTLGTGIGAGVVCDGKLLTGNRGLAGELGHTLIRRGSEARPCGCGRRGCLETYGSAGGVVKTALELLARNPEERSTLREIPAEELTSRKIAEAAEKGDGLAIRTFGLTGAILGEACADFAACFAPQAIILFGGVAGAGELLLRPAVEAFERNLLWIYKDSVKLILSNLSGADAALLGAAAFAIQKLA